jgi:hypothetical protein
MAAGVTMVTTIVAISVHMMAGTITDTMTEAVATAMTGVD